MNKELVSLAKQVNYVCPDRFVSGQIVEYDIKQANINILFKYGEIDQEKYEFLKNIPKYNREVIVGNMIKEDKKIYNTIQKGIKESKIKLFESNDIREHEVIRIANDAVYVNRINELKYTSFDGIDFVKKSISTCFLKLNNILFFINCKNDNINVDVKGLGENYQIHQPMISIIVNIITELYFMGVKPAMNSLNGFIEDYINYKLGAEYYRELTPEAKYRVIGGQFFLSEMEYIRPEIDINYNLYILRELSSVLYEIYTNNYRNL